VSILDFFRRRRFDDNRKAKFAHLMSEMLGVQIAAIGLAEVPNLATPVGAKALGYVYGFVDAALRTVRQDMSDASVGVPITFQVLRRVFPGHEGRYMDYLAKNLRTDDAIMRGVMLGGQQYLDFVGGKLKAPMGLARVLLEMSDSPRSDVGG